LTTCRRSDDKHYKLCENYQNVTLKDFGNRTDTKFHICYTNEKRIQLNEIVMSKDRIRINALNKEHKKQGHSESRYEIFKELPANSLSKNSQSVFLCEHLPIISITNKKQFNIINSERFTVNDINDEFIEIKKSYIKEFDQKDKKVKSEIIIKKIQVPIDKFQKWFHPAYSITSHKSQGSTIKENYTIHEWDKMSDKCKYVSLSRSAKWEYCNLV
jgi:ATP-dependent exoDNAse (exonuclease V) alpha subunit